MRIPQFRHELLFQRSLRRMDKIAEKEMIGFNTLLQDEGIEPAEVRLARHQSTRRNRPTPYELWLADDGRLELYQRIQRLERFSGVDFIAGFVATPLSETLFILSACLKTAV